LGDIQKEVFPTRSLKAVSMMWFSIQRCLSERLNGMRSQSVKERMAKICPPCAKARAICDKKNPRCGRCTELQLSCRDKDEDASEEDGHAKKRGPSKIFSRSSATWTIPQVDWSQPSTKGGCDGHIWTDGHFRPTLPEKFDVAKDAPRPRPKQGHKIVDFTVYRLHQHNGY